MYICVHVSVVRNHTLVCNFHLAAIEARDVVLPKAPTALEALPKTLLEAALAWDFRGVTGRLEAAGAASLGSSGPGWS